VDGGTSVGGGGDVIVIVDDDRLKELPINTPTPTREIPRAPKPSHDFVLLSTSVLASPFALLFVPSLSSSALVSLIIIFWLHVEALLLQMGDAYCTVPPKLTKILVS